MNPTTSSGYTTITYRLKKMGANMTHYQQKWLRNATNSTNRFRLFGELSSLTSVVVDECVSGIQPDFLSDVFAVFIKRGDMYASAVASTRQGTRPRAAARSA
jgi:hypothetical protein